MTFIDDFDEDAHLKSAPPITPWWWVFSIGMGLLLWALIGLVLHFMFGWTYGL